MIIFVDSNIYSTGNDIANLFTHECSKGNEKVYRLVWDAFKAGPPSLKWNSLSEGFSGLAALAFQVAPEITPKKIIDLLVETAVRTDAGPIVNPRGFIEAVEKEKTR